MFNSVNLDYKLDREQLTGIVNIQSFISANAVGRLLPAGWQCTANGEATNFHQGGKEVHPTRQQHKDTT